jgi:predicted nucleic acid-binding protein
VTPDVGNPAPVLLDTSAAVPIVFEDHEYHDAVFAALTGRERGLAGHAAFETFSVMTRLPLPARRSPAGAGRILAKDFPQTRFLSAEGSANLLELLASHGISGGSIYDALIGAAALEHGLPLMTRDRRAVPTYRALGVEVEVLD